MNRRHRTLWQAAAHCLSYPDDTLYDRLPLVGRCLADTPVMDPLLDFLARHTPLAAARHYVEVFDTVADRCLYLTWYTDGDTRRRGGALAGLKAGYRGHGLRLVGGELPDHLPVLLEFAARTGAPGQRLLAGFRPALELLHTTLTAFDTPYTSALTAVLTTLPHRGPTRPATARPPDELVGVEPVLLGYPTIRESTR